MAMLGRLLRIVQGSGGGTAAGRRPVGRRPVARTRPRTGGGVGTILRRLLR